MSFDESSAHAEARAPTVAVDSRRFFTDCCRRMKIATWNVNGIRARHLQLHEWLAAERPDVVCLQEIKALPSQVPALVSEMADYWSYWHGAPKGYSGVSLHVRKERVAEEPVFAHPDFDFENRIVVAQVGAVQIASIYVPNGGKDFPAKMRFLAALENYAAMAQRNGTAFVICGDLNIARAEIDVHPKERGPFTGQLPQERAWFERLLAGGLVDVGRALDPDNESLFTWWAPWRDMRARNIGWRLDYVLASKAFAETATSCAVLREIGTSDHGPVLATFAD